MISDAELRRRNFQSWKWDHASLLDQRDELRAALTQYVNALRDADALQHRLDAEDVPEAVNRIIASIDDSHSLAPREDVLDWFLS